MRLVFGPDDHDQFEAAKVALLDRFQAWLAPDADSKEMAHLAALALDWKWAYGDGHLGRWTTSDVGEFLLEWCPRKLSMSPDQCEPIPLSLAALTAFLAEEGLLAPGSSKVDHLAVAATAMTAPFLEAMGDEANFGLAKSLFASAAADGVDLSDPDRMQQWMEEFNARPDEDRLAALATPRRPALPPVVLPDDAEVAASRAAAPILAKFAALAEFARDGRKLTQKGNVTLADARVLVGLLDTGDVMDPKSGNRTFRTTSAGELGGLRQIVVWARKAGVVRVAHGRMHATKKGLAIARDPAAFFDRAVDALVAAGPVASQRAPDRWLAWPDVDALLDQLSVALLIGPYAGRCAFSMEDICSEAANAVLRTFHFPNTSDEEVARRVAYDVTDMIDAFELAGVVRRIGAVEPDEAEAFISRRRDGGAVELTAAGIVAVRRLLIEGGYEAPVAGRFADATAVDLLLGADPEDFAALMGEIEAWRRRRTPEDAARGLAEAARTLDDPARKNIALAVMGMIDLEIAGPQVRALAADPGSRGFALCWLVDNELEEPGALFDPEDVSWFVDVLAQRMVIRGPEGLCEALALAGDHERQIGVINRLWRSPSSATDFVLAAIGEVHPVKVVAKAGRKALFKRRSWNPT